MPLYDDCVPTTHYWDASKPDHTDLRLGGARNYRVRAAPSMRRAARRDLIAGTPRVRGSKLVQRRRAGRLCILCTGAPPRGATRPYKASTHSCAVLGNICTVVCAVCSAVLCCTLPSLRHAEAWWGRRSHSIPCCGVSPCLCAVLRRRRAVLQVLQPYVDAMGLPLFSHWNATMPLWFMHAVRAGHADDW